MLTFAAVVSIVAVLMTKYFLFSLTSAFPDLKRIKKLLNLLYFFNFAGFALFQERTFLNTKAAEVFALAVLVDVLLQGLVYGLVVDAFGVEGVLYLNLAPFVELGFFSDEGSRIALLVDELVLFQLLYDVIDVAGRNVPLTEFQSDVAFAMLRLDA